MALEINMRPAGGFTPDMIDYAYSTSLYQIYADMVAFRRTASQLYRPLTPTAPTSAAGITDSTCIAMMRS